MGRGTQGGALCAVMAGLVLTSACAKDSTYSRSEAVGRSQSALGGQAVSSAPTINTFVAYASQSVTLGAGTHSLGGDIGVAAAGSSAPLLQVGNFDGLDALRTLYASSVTLGTGALAGNIDASSVTNSGGFFAALAPYPSSMPPLPNIAGGAAGTTAVSVAALHNTTLNPGSYGSLSDNGVVFLNPGTYSFSSVTLGNNAQLIAQPGGMTTVLIAGRLVTGTFAQVRPSLQPANALTVSVAATDGSGGSATSIGADAQIVSLLAVPNGTLSLADGVQATGAFAGASIVGGANVQLTFQSGFPDTVLTFAVPTSLSPLAPVLLGSNSVDLDPGANVVSGTVVSMGAGGVDADANSALNDVWSRGTAELDLGVHVRGTLHAARVVRDPSATVSATDANPTFDPPQIVSWNVVYPAGTGAAVSVAPGGTRSLSPGLYGTIEVDGNATLNLASGTYYFASLNVEAHATVSLNQANGPVIVYVNGSLTLNGGFAAGGAEPNLLIGYLGSQPVLVGATFDGAIVAPAAELQLLSTAGVNKGFFAAKDVELGIQVQVQYRLPGALTAASALNLTCVNNKGGGQYEALFGYNNATANLTNVPVGAQNQFTPSPAGQGQPEDFQPVNTQAAFAVVFGGSPLTWTLAGASVVAASGAPSCPTASCAPGCKRGQQCVGGHCVTECGDGLCGGDESCNTCPADCGCASGQACINNACATPVQCGVGWECGAGASFGVNVDCGACSGGRTCNHHLCQ